MMVGGSTAGSSGKVQLNYRMYNTSIGLEVHTKLNTTRSHLFTLFILVV